MKNTNVICIILVFVFVAWTLFIFSNSLKNGEESGKISGGVVDKVKPLIDPEDKIQKDAFHVFVRKMAHGIEYFVHGLLAAALCHTIALKKHPPMWYLPFMLSLLTAVVDEFIQMHTQRTSSIIDVLIDFCGASIGIIVIFAALFASKKIKLTKNIQKSKNS